MPLGFGGVINREQNYMGARTHGRLEELGGDFRELEHAVHPDSLLYSGRPSSGVWRCTGLPDR